MEQPDSAKTTDDFSPDPQAHLQGLGASGMDEHGIMFRQVYDAESGYMRVIAVCRCGWESEKAQTTYAALVIGRDHMKENSHES